VRGWNNWKENLMQEVNDLSGLIPMTGEPLTIEDLAEQSCDCPVPAGACDRIPARLSSRGAHIAAAYDRRSGRLVLGCQECRTLYAMLHRVGHRVGHQVVQ
jgi:hypothetical protein